jgi:thiosulfate/3-mercaptopyruvate sulfurtransferase
MIPNSNNRRYRVPGAALVTIALLVVAAGPVSAGPELHVVANAAAPISAQSSEVPASGDELIQPEELAQLLAGDDAHEPMLVHIGFAVLFRAGHIPGSRHIGPASTPDGLANLKQFLRETPRDREVVLYCGCCPWTDCPNVRPALQAVREMGLKNVRLLYLPNSLQHDWLEKGLPITKADQ